MKQKENKKFNDWWNGEGYKYKAESNEESEWLVVVRYWAWKAWYERSKCQP